MLADIELTPRFDTGWQILLNAVGIALWLLAITLMVRRPQRGTRMSTWDWVAIVLHVSIAGVYVPLGPAAWLAHFSIRRDAAR